MKSQTDKTKSRKVTFQIAATPGCKVFVAGTFNNWDPSRHQMRDNPDHGVYRATIALPKGRHEYKFVVDGQWLVDPNCHDIATNEYGSVNSVVSV